MSKQREWRNNMAKSDFETFLREEVAGSNEYEYGSGIPMQQDAIDFLAEVDQLRAQVRQPTFEVLDGAPSEYVYSTRGDTVQACPVCGEPMTRAMPDGTLGCNLCYAEGR